jgi:hypothetical protein
MRARDPSRAWRLAARAACLVGILAVPCHAEPPRAAVVWYRSAEGCPDATEFLARLGDRASLARVAEAGDYVDFVVTLTATEQGSSGRLERQTQSGTVAIQEIRDRECARVADALALSLALALDPAAPLVHRAPEPEPRVEAAPGPSAAPARTAAAQPPLQGSSGSRAVVVARSARAEPDRKPPEPPSRTLAWFVGAHGGLMTGITPDEVAVRGDLFAEMASSEARAANGSETHSFGPDASEGPTLRLAAVISSSSPEYETVGTVRHSMAAGRADACWPSAGTTWIALRPCLALELGATAAVGSRRTGVADMAFWAALGALGRGRAWVSHVIGVEAEFGLVVPLRRYIVGSAQGTLYENRRVGLAAAVGPVLRLY